MSMNDEWGIELSGEPERVAPTPQDWGFPEKSTLGEREVWNRQEAFLGAYAKCGKRRMAAKAVGITVWCVEGWLKVDRYNIKQRMELAHQEYVERLEEDMDSAINDDPKARYQMPAAVQRIFRLKAEAPEKYREEVKVIGAEVPLRIMEKAQELARQERERALQEGAVEGQYRVVDGQGQS